MDPTTQSSAGAGYAPAPVRSGGLHICIVDDDASLRRALTRLLVAAGFVVEAFPSAEEFLASGASADCFVLDVLLGGMSGLELHDHLVRAGSTTPVIFVTAYDDLVARESARKGWTVPCVRKPFDEHAILAAIHQAAGAP